jgi:hypothetical protein
MSTTPWSICRHRLNGCLPVSEQSELRILEEDAVTLWRPVGPLEMELIRKAAMRAFPPRLPDQPIFYPVLSEAYAVKIARDWNVPASGKGYVTRFHVAKRFLDQYQVQEAGGREHLEYWIPAADLPAFNAALLGEIEVIAEFS